MKIKYEKSKNSYRLYREFNDIVSNRKRILKDNKSKICNSFVKNGILFLLLIILAGLFLYDFYKDRKAIDLTYAILCYTLIVFYFTYFMFIYNAYTMYKKYQSSGELQFDEKAISDLSADGTCFSTSWENIEGVIAGKYGVVILVKDNLVMFLLDIKYKNQVLKAVQKYQPNIIVRDFQSK